MADLRQCSREFLTDFIALYESFPCVWKIKSKEYSNRDKKRQAYEILLEKFKEIDPTANRETIVKKINSLRSVYRKELAKVNKSHRSGAGEYDIYKPSLWYFHLLHFLNDQETPRQSRSNMDEDEESTIIEAPGRELEEDAHEIDADTGPNEAPAITTSEPSTSGSVSRSLSCNTSRSQSSNRKRKVVSNDDGTNEVMALVGKKLDSLQADDAFQVFGKYVANKLRHVNSQQNTFAQKLISDILFEADMGTLNRSFQVVDMTSRRQNDFGLMSEQTRYPQNFQNIPRQWGIPHTSSQLEQYQVFLPPMSHQYVPEQSTHTQEHQTIGQMQPISSQIIPQQSEQTQNQHFISQQAGDKQQISQQFTQKQTETPSTSPSRQGGSTAANFVSTFQAN